MIHVGSVYAYTLLTVMHILMVLRMWGFNKHA